MARVVVFVAVLALVAIAPRIGSADDDVPTVQQRYATKLNGLSLHLLGTAHFRGDFFHQIGWGGAMAFYPWEDVGFELRGVHYHTWLSDSAIQIQEATGRIPDTRSRNGALLGGARISMGYGKVQVHDAFVVHFDPQWVVLAGATFADDGRVLPTAMAGLGLLLHFDYGIQAQLDLLAMLDVEERGGRGAVASVGFAPFISIGWKLDLGDV